MPGLGKLDVIGRTYRHLGRYRRIITVLIKYGFGDLLETLQVHQYLDVVINFRGRSERSELKRLSRPARLRLVCEELGTTFIKLGQMLSIRADLFSQEYIEEFSKLQDEVPPFPNEIAWRIIEEDLGAAPEEIFAEISPKPTAAASIAQGYHARLHDGREVFVKVRRPDIDKEVRIDLEILADLASLIERHSDNLAMVSPSRLVREFSRSINEEINLVFEAINARQFAEQFKGRRGIRVPEIHKEYCSERVLTMEFIHGIKASELDSLRAADCDLRNLANLGAELMLEQFFVHGFFHADLHPGNILVIPEENSYCYLDFGQMGRMSQRERDTIVGLVIAAVAADEKRLGDAVLKMTSSPPDLDREELERDLAAFTAHHFRLSMKELAFSNASGELYEICRHHGLCVKPYVYLLGKAVGMVEEMGRQYNPEYQMADQVQPFLQRLQKERLNPKRLLKAAGLSGMELHQLLRALPDQVHTLLQQLRDGRLKVEIRNPDVANASRRCEQTGNRMILGLILAATILSSSLLTAATTAPLWHGVSILGLLGFTASGMLGAFLGWNLWRSSRHR